MASPTGLQMEVPRMDCNLPIVQIPYYTLHATTSLFDDLGWLKENYQLRAITVPSRGVWTLKNGKD